MCVFYFFHTHQRPKPKTFFFFWGWVGTSFAREIDRWWVYWLLIIYTLLLPWWFSTLIYIFFRNVEIFNSPPPPPQVTKKFWKKILNIQENSMSDLFCHLGGGNWKFQHFWKKYKLVNFMNNWFSLEVMKLYILCSMLTLSPRKMSYMTEPKYVFNCKRNFTLAKVD